MYETRSMGFIIFRRILRTDYKDGCYYGSTLLRLQPCQWL